MIKDSFKTAGTLDIVLTDENNQVKEKFTVPNLIVTRGRNYIAHRMTGNSNAVMSHMAVGTTSTAAALGDTTLGTETARVALTSASNSSPGNVVTYVATFNPGTPSTANALTEAAIFNAASGGEMLCRTVFSVVNKGTLDTLTITWTVSNS
jgi:hypothetical protein